MLEPRQEEEKVEKIERKTNPCIGRCGANQQRKFFTLFTMFNKLKEGEVGEKKANVKALLGVQQLSKK